MSEAIMYNTFFVFHFFGAICVFSAAAITFLNMVGMAFTTETRGMWNCSYWAMKMAQFWLFSIILILVSSIYLVFSRWGWKFPWIDVSLVMLILMMALSPIIIRRLKEVHQAIDSETENIASLKSMEKVRDRFLWNSVTIMSLEVAGIIHLMIEKMGTLGSILTFFIMLILGFLLSKVVLRWANKLNPIPVVNHIEGTMTTH
jgi:hypothetical protein